MFFLVSVFSQFFQKIVGKLLLLELSQKFLFLFLILLRNFQESVKTEKISQLCINNEHTQTQTFVSKPCM